MNDASPVLPCPNPHKIAYRTRGEAARGLTTVRGIVAVDHVYLCRCGSYHISTAAWSGFRD